MVSQRNYFITLGVPRVQLETGPTRGGQEETQKRGRPLQSARWQFDTQGHLYLWLVLGLKMSRLLHLPIGILDICVEALTGLRHVFRPDVSPAHYSLQSVSSQQLSLPLPWSSFRDNRESHSLYLLLQ